MPKATRIGIWILIAAGLCGLLAGGACRAGKASAPAALTAPAAEAEAWADKTLAGLSLERKIGQMIAADLRGEYVAEDDPRLLKWLGWVRDLGVGTVVVYGGTPHDTASLLNRLQAASALPLLASSDFEGGPGQQIAGATEFPGNMALAAIGSEDLAYAVGKAGAAEGRAVGIHLTYSPVVDIQTRPENPVLGVRSFGADLEQLGRLAGAYIRGYQENGMWATAKHYPGRGEVELIPGTEFTINRKTADRFEAEDAAAFKKAFAAGVAFVMSEHIAVPAAADGSELPASVERKLASDWLRGRLGFQGILTSDDMWYAKIVDRFGAEEACVMAVAAGHDMILKPADPAAAIRGLVDAVRSGRIPEAQIDASVRRVLVAKARLNLHQSRLVDPAGIAAVVGRAEHRNLLRKIADESLTLVRNDGALPIGPDGPGAVVHISLQRKEIDPAPALVDAKIKAAFPGTKTFLLGPTTSPARYEEALKAAASSGTVLVSLFHGRLVYKDNGSLKPSDAAFFDRLIQAKPKAVIAMSYGNPYLAGDFKKAAAFLVGYGEGGFYGNQTVYADSLVSLLKGEIKPLGRLPVDASPEFPMGTGVRY